MDNLYQEIPDTVLRFYRVAAGPGSNGTSKPPGKSGSSVKSHLPAHTNGAQWRYQLLRRILPRETAIRIPGIRIGHKPSSRHMVKSQPVGCDQP